MKQSNNSTTSLALSFLAASSYFLVAALPVSAQQSQRTMTISPPTVTQNVNPGSRAEGTIKIINDSTEPLTFSVNAQDYIVQDTHGTPSILPPNVLTKRFSAASWINVVPNNFTVFPHEKQTIQYFMQVPIDARPGGHYAAMVFNPVNVLGLKGTGAAVEAQIGTLFLIDINGPINQEAVVSKFQAPGFSEYGPVKVFTQIANNGDLHIRPQGTISVTDVFGRTVGKQNLDAQNIFPTAARDFENIFGSTFMIGPYKAKLAATYGKTNALPLVAAVTFWVFPWRITLVILVLIIAIVLGYKLWKKNKQNPPVPKTPATPVEAPKTAPTVETKA